MNTAFRPVVALLALLLSGAAGADSLKAPQLSAAEQAAQANVQLGVGYLRQNNLGVAQQVLERALAQNPKDPAVHTSLGLLYERLALPLQADKHYARAVKLAPRDPSVLNNYAVFLCRNGEAPRGERLFLQAAANPLYRTPEVALTNAAVCARSNARVPAAEQYLRKALNLRATFPDALYQMSEISLEQGKALAARAFVQRLLSVGPATPEALWLGVRVERVAGDQAAVTDYLRRLEREFPQFEPARVERSAQPATATPTPAG